LNPRPEGVAGEVLPRVVKGGSVHQFRLPGHLESTTVRAIRGD